MNKTTKLFAIMLLLSVSTASLVRAMDDAAAAAAGASATEAVEEKRSFAVSAIIIRFLARSRGENPTPANQEKQSRLDKICDDLLPLVVRLEGEPLIRPWVDQKQRELDSGILMGGGDLVLRSVIDTANQFLVYAAELEVPTRAETGRLASNAAKSIAEVVGEGDVGSMVVPSWLLLLYLKNYAEAK